MSSKEKIVNSVPPDHLEALRVLREVDKDKIDSLRQQCEALAESLEQVSAECKAHIQMLDEKGVLVAVTNVAKANQTLAQYKKFKEGG